MTSNEYRDLGNVSQSLQNYGAALKVLGIIVLVGCVLGGISVGPPFGYILMIGAVLAAIMLHVTGTIIGAGGDALAALREIAINTRRDA